MSTINVTMDASSVVLSAERMTRAIGATTATIKDASLVSAQYDANGRLITATMKGIDSEGRQVVTTFRNIGGVLVAVNTQFVNLNKTTADTKKRISDIGKALNEVSGMFQRFAGYRALAGLTDGLTEGFEAAKKFQTQISLIRTISQDNQLSFGDWAKRLRQVSDETGFGIADVTKTAYDAISNQVAKGQAVIPFLKEAADFARVTGSTLEQAGNLQASALNAYNKNISESREISALFFATIDEGRVVAGQMADTFGRVAILAKGLDVPIQELSASIAFLTQKGVTTDDAFTFMRNVFVQLQKPSEALSAFFRKIGVESGQAAVATYGFMGILRKIRDEVGAGNASVASLFPEIRAQQPIQAALNDFEGFDRIVGKFNNTAQLLQNYQKAVDIRAESPADFIEKEFNKIKNTFTVDLGQSLLKFVKDLLVGMKQISGALTGNDSLSGALNVVIIGIRDVTIAIVAFRTAAALTTTGVAAYTVAMAVAGRTSTLTAAEVKAANVAMASTIIGLVAALAALAATKYFFTNDIISTPDLFEHRTESMKKMREEIIALNATQLRDPFAQLRPVANAEFGTALQGLAQLAIRSDAALDRIRVSNRRNRDESQNAFQTYTDALKNNLKELEKKITDSETIIERGKRGLETFRDTLNRMVDDVGLENLVGQQKVNFLKEREDALIARAQAGYRSNVPERIAEAEKQLAEAAQARRDRFKAEQDLFRQQNPRLNEQDYRNRALEDRKTFESDLNSIFALRVQLNNTLTTQRQAQIAATREEISLEKRRLRDVEDKYKAFNEFSAFDAGGNVRSDYRTPGDERINTAKILADFDLRANQARRAVSETGSVEARLRIEDTIAERRRRMVLEIGALERSEAVRVAQTRTQQLKKNFDDQLSANSAATVRAATAQNSLLSTLGNDLQGLRGVATSITSYGIAPDMPALNTAANRRAKALYPILQSRSQELQTALTEYDLALRKSREDVNRIGDTVIPKQENILALAQASRQVRERTESAYRALGLSKEQFETLVIPGSTTGQTFGDLFRDIRNSESQLFSNQGAINEVPLTRERLERDFRNRVSPDLQSLNRLAPDLFPNADPEAFARQQTPLVQNTSAMDNLRTAIGNLTTTIQRIGLPTGNPVPNAPPALNSQPTPRALGGWMGGRPTGVIGPDSMYHVGKGEFMVNAESAAMYPDTLQAINATRRGSSTPQMLGGNVSNHRVGDIYITVNEARDGQDTSRQVWNKLRRESRRGNI